MLVPDPTLIEDPIRSTGISGARQILTYQDYNFVIAANARVTIHTYLHNATDSTVHAAKLNNLSGTLEELTKLAVSERSF